MTKNILCFFAGALVTAGYCGYKKNKEKASKLKTYNPNVQRSVAPTQQAVQNNYWEDRL